MTLGEQIKKARKGKKMTQSELCDKTNISLASLCRYENGTAIPSLERVVELSKALGVTLEYFGVDDSEMTLGKRIIEARWECGMSRQELSDLVGIHINTLGSYERDEVEMPFGVACDIAEALDVTLDYLAGKEDW